MLLTFLVVLGDRPQSLTPGGQGLSHAASFPMLAAWFSTSHFSFFFIWGPHLLVRFRVDSRLGAQSGWARGTPCGVRQVSHQLNDHSDYCLFGGYTQWCSVMTIGSARRDPSWEGSWNLTWCWRRNPGGLPVQGHCPPCWTISDSFLRADS